MKSVNPSATLSGYSSLPLRIINTSKKKKEEDRYRSPLMSFRKLRRVP